MKTSLKYFAILAFVFSAFLNDKSNAADSGCGAGWEAYKDERCFRILDDTFRTFDDAVKACAKLEISSTLPIIRTLEEQNFLSNYLFKTQKKLENFWLGLKFTTSFKWTDNTDLSFTNWVAQGPRNKPNYCVQIQADEAVLGKWIDEPCEKKDMVVCEKLPTWSIDSLQQVLLEARKELRDSLNVQKENLVAANKKIDDQKQQSASVKEELAAAKADLVAIKSDLINLKQTIIPIGFTYTQLPNDKSPSEIWPWMTWKEVSSNYAGVFFRVTGGEAAPFGQFQDGNAPRVIRIDNAIGLDGHHDSVSTSANEWTGILYSGSTSNTGVKVFLKFLTSGGEVRPRNTAVRLWTRIG